MPFFSQVRGEQFADVAVVVDDQYVIDVFHAQLLVDRAATRLVEYPQASSTTDRLAPSAHARLQRIRIDAFEAAEVDAPQVRILARLMERIDPAMPAEIMFRDARIELIEGEIVLARQDAQFSPLR